MRFWECLWEGRLGEDRETVRYLEQTEDACPAGPPPLPLLE